MSGQSTKDISWNAFWNFFWLSSNLFCVSLVSMRVYAIFGFLKFAKFHLSNQKYRNQRYWPIHSIICMLVCSASGHSHVAANNLGKFRFFSNVLPNFWPWKISSFLWVLKLIYIYTKVIDRLFSNYAWKFDQLVCTQCHKLFWRK